MSAKLSVYNHQSHKFNHKGNNNIVTKENYPRENHYKDESSPIRQSTKIREVLQTKKNLYDS